MLSLSDKRHGYFDLRDVVVTPSGKRAEVVKVTFDGRLCLHYCGTPRANGNYVVLKPELLKHAQ